MSTSRRHWILYVAPPIDLKWEFLPTIRQALKKSSIVEWADEITSAWTGPAKGILRRHDSWHEVGGDDIDEMNRVHVFFYPSDTEMDFGFVVKPGDNGTTFIITQARMPHIEDLIDLEQCMLTDAPEEE